jgi:hypothetical protein
VAETGADGIPASLPSDAEATAATVAESDDWEPETPFSRLRGPFDRAEVTRDDTRVELGSLWVAITDGVQVALQVDESTQTPVGIQLSLGTSGAYLQAYAAPRTEGIWPEIRTEVAQSVVAAGGRAELVSGPLGKELRLHQRGGVPIRLLGWTAPVGSFGPSSPAPPPSTSRLATRSSRSSARRWSTGAPRRWRRASNCPFGCPRPTAPKPRVPTHRLGESRPRRGSMTCSPSNGALRSPRSTSHV